MEEIAVIIPVHNRLGYTKKGLKSLYDSINNSSQPGRIKVILVDDGSCDGTSDWVAENYPDVIILNGDGNLWWSGAVNLGAKHALNVLKSDYVLLWNNDTKPHIDYFDNLQKIISNKHPAANTIIGSKIYYMNKPDMICSMGCIFNPKTGKKVSIYAGKTDCSEYEKIISPDCCAGMGTLIHKSVFGEIGFWDEKTFPQYSGDSDYTLRAKKHGINLLVYPYLKIYNDSTSTGTLHNNSFRLLITSFFSLRSTHNIIKNIKFYQRHAESSFAYFSLIKKYFGYVGGFFKWKILSFFGKKRDYKNDVC